MSFFVKISQNTLLYARSNDHEDSQAKYIAEAWVHSSKFQTHELITHTCVM